MIIVFIVLGMVAVNVLVDMGKSGLFEDDRDYGNYRG